MPAYNITNTAGVVVATINPASTTGVTFPITLIGQGISLYGPTIAENQYHQLENFALPTPPVNPVEGMFWYRSDLKEPHFYNGSQFIPLLSLQNSVGGAFEMLPAAATVDLTNTGPITIFQAPGSGQRFHPTGVMMIPVGAVGATTPATFHMYVSNPEDVMENALVANLTTNSHAYFPIEGTTRFLSGTESLVFERVNAATGGALTVRVIVFGFVS